MKIYLDIKYNAKTILLVELKRKGMSYKQLAECLSRSSEGKVTEASVANKLSRGSFSADFFIDVLAAIENYS